jgi:hypothetical protein
MKKVFLGGTCNNSKWREQLVIPQLEVNKIDYFNPVVENWTDEAWMKEIFERENCDYCLYFITPKMTGVYSIAEVIDDSNKRPEKTIFYFVGHDGKESFDEFQLKSLDKVGKMVELNGGKYFKNIEDVIKFIK